MRYKVSHPIGLARAHSVYFDRYVVDKMFCWQQMSENVNSRLLVHHNRLNSSSRITP